MNTCATCRYFGHENPLMVSDYDADAPWDEKSAHHSCARIIHGNAMGAPKSALTEPAVVTDGSGYAARLRVLPTFGCVLHDARDAGGGR